MFANILYNMREKLAKVFQNHKEAVLPRSGDLLVVPTSHYYICRKLWGKPWQEFLFLPTTTLFQLYKPRPSLSTLVWTRLPTEKIMGSASPLPNKAYPMKWKSFSLGLKALLWSGIPSVSISSPRFLSQHQRCKPLESWAICMFLFLHLCPLIFSVSQTCCCYLCPSESDSFPGQAK